MQKISSHASKTHGRPRRTERRAYAEPTPFQSRGSGSHLAQIRDQGQLNPETSSTVAAGPLQNGRLQTIMPPTESVQYAPVSDPTNPRVWRESVVGVSSSSFEGLDARMRAPLPRPLSNTSIPQTSVSAQGLADARISIPNTPTSQIDGSESHMFLPTRHRPYTHTGYAEPRLDTASTNHRAGTAKTAPPNSMLPGSRSGRQDSQSGHVGAAASSTSQNATEIHIRACLRRLDDSQKGINENLQKLLESRDTASSNQSDLDQLYSGIIDAQKASHRELREFISE